MAPFGSDDGGKKNIKMYVKRVFISDEFHGELVSCSVRLKEMKTFCCVAEDFILFSCWVCSSLGI
jgi:hypothetical protein